MYEDGKSAELDKLAAALAKAQGQFPAVPKTGKNPHLNNEYSTLDDIIGAVRKPLAENGLSFVQLLGGNGKLSLTTILMHESGQYLKTEVTVASGEANRGVNALQALGAGITYMKRYSLGALLGIATEGDTDGEGAAPPPKQAQRRAPAKKAPAKKAPAKKAEAEAEPTLDEVFGEPDLTRPPGDEANKPEAPGNPKDLYQYFNPLTYYKSIPHMLQALRKQRAEPQLQWGTGEQWYQEALGDLTEYAQAQVAQAAIAKTAKKRKA